MSLAQYLKSFSRLRTYKDRKKWSALTTYQAPHKAFLLLSIMDMIAQGSIFENFIGPRFRVDGLAKDYEVLLSNIMMEQPGAYDFMFLSGDFS